MQRLVLLIIGLFVSVQSIADGRGSVVVAEVHHGHVTYEAEGKRSDLDGVISLLRNRATRTGIGPHDDVAFVLVSNNLTIAQVQALYSTLQAYGFREIKVLVYAPEKVRLSELSVGSKAVPFSKDSGELMRGMGLTADQAR